MLARARAAKTLIQRNLFLQDASGTPLPASTGGGGEPEQPLANSVADTHLLVEWLAENYADFGINIKIISNRSPEGAQFCMGFGGTVWHSLASELYCLNELYD